MSSLIVEVCQVGKVTLHPNADRLCLAQVKGWQCVVGRNGDVPLGTNVAADLGISKFRPPPRVLTGVSDPEVDHPLFTKFTDVEALQNFPDVFKPGEIVHVSEKIDGNNCRVGIVKGVKMAGSRTLCRKIPAEVGEWHKNVYWYPHSLQPVQSLLNEYAGRGHEQVILYGEVIRVKGALSFLAFDMMVDGKYLDASDFRLVMSTFNITMAPLLFSGPFAYDTIKALSQGGSTVPGIAGMREGVVVRPYAERTDPKVGRVIMKMVGDDYLIANRNKDATDI